MASKKTPIQRSSVLGHPLLGAGLSRELGLNDRKIDMSQAWSHGIRPSEIWRGKGQMILSNLVYDQALQRAIVGMKVQKGTSVGSEVRYVGEKCDTWGASESDASQITSLSLSPSRILLVTELDGPYAASVINLGFGEGKDAASFWDKACHAASFGDKACRAGILKQSPGVTYWASTANPYSGTASFAIAASNGPLLLSHCEGGGWCRKTLEGDVNAYETMAVDWLSPHVMMSGGKDGGLRLWDVRGGRKGRGLRIQHPSQINHARKIDENTIVIAGLESQLCTYDLRFQSNLATRSQVTQPYNRFPAYGNRDVGHIGAGFDVYGDLAAAVTGDGRVLLWDVKRGIELKHSFWRPIISKREAFRLQFADGEGSEKGLRLLIAAGQGISQLSW